MWRQYFQGVARNALEWIGIGLDAELLFLRLRLADATSNDSDLRSKAWLAHCMLTGGGCTLSVAGSQIEIPAKKV